ncbi:hypothetical protein FZEAL_4832 [Fusarium zealandicum]|uniref:histidine kinase n=1 Tax=Fusarium zealandicum TaxID=1053134 RepID=A0A8H4ULF7_9HYPO|nr:hypothetical protein FZEAL_4832 [Fusarium zealandicum]
MASTSGRTFFPRADAAVLSAERQPSQTRTDVVAPIYDPDNLDKPLGPWIPQEEACYYPEKKEPYAPSAIPEQPTCPSSRYLRAHLAKNERLRLSMLWYYTRDILTEPEFLSGLREKAFLAQESTGWEFVVIGILDVNVYIRLATVGLELTIMPRGETLCAHTVTQPPGSVFLLPNMMEDWRFQKSPYVEQGGLTAYAGVPLRVQNETGECVGLGSLCVASRTSQPPLAKPQQQTLARLADWVVADIIQCARARRQRERHRMSELIAEAQRDTKDAESEEPVLRIMRIAYPEAVINLQSSKADRIETEGRRPIPSSDIDNGLWEDTAYIDDFITNSNQRDPPSDRVVRFISAQCESMLGPSLLVVATKDFRLIFDDVDAWFVQTCAGMLSQRWQKRLLSEVMSTKEKFLRGVSHQLRTPIHGILGAAELLAEDMKNCDLRDSDPVELAKKVDRLVKSSVYLDTISTAGRDLMSTVNGMITLNRWADIAMADRQYAVHSIGDLEMELAKGISQAAPGDSRHSPSIFFNYDLPPGCDSFRIDLNLLRDSLLPLVVNAVQNTAEGIVVVTVSIGQDGKALVVDIEDTGCGIHPDDQKRVFQLYEKVGEHSTGAGLGLTLATKFATLLHGSVELVSSDIDRGSHFRATFRDVDYTHSPLELQPMASKLENLPSRFHNMLPSSAGGSLCVHLTKSLTRNGFTPSQTPEDCIVVLDLAPDLEQHRKHLSLIPPEQVAICLVPALQERWCFEPTHGNIVYVSGPFLTSTISTALEEADRLVAKMNVSRGSLDQPKKSICTPGNDACSSSDEGYGSMDASPSPNEQLGQTAGAIGPYENINSTSIHQPIAEPLRESSTPIPILASLAKPRALLVDDNIVNLRIMQMYCKKRGLPYSCATDGQQAVDIFTEHQSLSASGKETAIQLILMDLQMPVCDGIEATRQIRLLEQRHGWNTSVLFVVTGQDSPLDRAAADGAGADEYLVKPVGMKLLDYGLKRHFPAFEVG